MIGQFSGFVMAAKQTTQSIGKMKRWLLGGLMALLLLPSILLAGSQPARAFDPLGGALDAAANPDPWTATALFLENIGSSDEGCKKFFTKPDGSPSGDCDGSRGENHLKFVLQKEGDKNQGYDPGNRPVPAKIKKLAGNPYVIVASDAHGDFRPENFPPGVTTNQMRFVLAEVNNKSKDDLDIFGGTEGNVFIWRNEFNPNLVIEIRYEPGSVENRATLQGDEKHFAYDPHCTGSFGDDTMISDTDGASDLPGTDAESKDDLEQWLKDNNIKVAQICDESTSFFAEAMKNALEAVSGFLGGLIDSLSNALGDIVDVGTIASVPGLTNAWKTIRDFVNIIFILVLSAIAFSTIIRFDTEKYSVRALLPRLIFAVIAVNFSLLLVQIMTNLAFIIAQPFKEAAFTLVTNPPANGSLIDPAAGIGEAAMGILVLLVIIAAMVVLLGFFIVRILVIWLLAALSPFVFLFMVLPVTRSLASNWWKNAIKWIFMAPIAFIVLFIAAEVVSGGRATAQSTQDPGFILKVGFFAGALIAAVVIPYKVGGEVMGRAVGTAKKTGRFSKGAVAGAGKAAAGAAGSTAVGRAGKAFLEQRQQNQAQTAQLRAADWQSRVGQVPGVGRLATGADRGMIATQQAALEKKYAGDIDSLNLDTGSQRMIARGDVKGLESAGLHDAAKLAKKPAGRRAAGRILAQNGSLNRDTILGGPGAPLELNPGQSDQVAAGNQTAMKSVNPVLGNMNRQGDWSGDSLRAITAHAQSAQSGQIKDMHWSDIKESLQSKNPHEQAAATRFVQNVSADALKKNFSSDNRNYVDSSEERAALADSLHLAGRPDASNFKP
jgi:hypothetical protein